MKKLILALAAMLITGSAVASPDEIDLMYFEGSTKDIAETCAAYFRPPPVIAFRASPEEEECGYAVHHWMDYTGRLDLSPETIGDPRWLPAAICGAEIILRYNDDTPIADALAAEWDTACGEAPAIM